MWEFPWLDEREQESSEEALAKRYGGRWKVGSVRGHVRHSVTDRRFRIEVVEASLQAGREVAEGPEAAWFSRPDLARVPVTGLVEKVLRLCAG
jgi:adenine-specific DNA glycosylase